MNDQQEKNDTKEQELEIELQETGNNAVDVELPPPSLPEEDTDPPPQDQDEEKNQDWVEVDDPKVQARLDNLYKQTKKSDARNAMLTDMLVRQQKILDEQQQFISQFKQNEEKKSAAQAEQALVERVRLARDEGDDDAYDRALTELIEYRVQTKGAEKTPAPMPDEQKQKDAQTYYSLAQEKDETGNYKRPWLYEEHPDHKKAISKGIELYMQMQGTNPQDPKLFERALLSLDAVMNQDTDQEKKPKAQNRAPDYMQPSNLTHRKISKKITLSPVEQEIARKLGMHAGWKDPIKKMAQAKEKWGKK